MLACLSCLAVAGTAGAVSISRVPFLGWTDAVRVTNGQVDLVVVPQIGRIMRYGYVGGPNLLWTAQEQTGQPYLDVGGWKNYGGDKLWPAPQADWNWPPDPDLDGGAATVRIDGNRVLLQGPQSRRTGIRFQRTIRMDAATGGVAIENRVTNLARKPVALAIWQIAQMNDPDEAFLPLADSAVGAEGWAAYDPGQVDPTLLTRVGLVLHIRRHLSRGLKYGAGSPRGYVAARRGEITFTMSGEFDKRAKYPDDGRAQQLYTNPDPAKYVELELNGPITKLLPNRSASFLVRWSLTTKRRS